MLWGVLLCLAVSGAVYASSLTWSRHQESPTVISLERDYKQWNTSFPALTFCPFNKTSEEAVARVIDSLVNCEKEKTHLESFIKALASATFRDFDKVPKVNCISPNDYKDLVINVSLDLEYEDLTSNLQEFKGEWGWSTTVLLELGVCFTFNSRISDFIDPRKKGLPNLKAGKSYVGDPLSGPIFATMINLNVGGKVFIHNDGEVPDITSKGELLPVLHFKTLQLSAVSIVSTDDVASLSISQRKCRLDHESNLMVSPHVYSYNFCRMDCRMRLSHQLCRCVPYFYWSFDTSKYKVCDYEGMQCLSKNKEMIINLRGNHLEPLAVKCPCFPTCEDTNYLIANDNSYEWYMGTNLKWELVEYPTIRFKRNILFGGTKVLVAIGGIAGLFLGCSVISFVEIFCWILYNTMRFLKQL